ncbi:peptide synthetase [Tolypothrix sp. NIES-4075]|uniref:non-ribosomal peptide synthetase n=1 Tax=Tolypothrix sp. NIES-4075 TaxID=2005459 RepID=UPI000B5C5D1B|nr:non-ribosomal peptide synthetase [Tolypothrix sp. NIES-4075]GAX45365.1 peptide synthetase [Tolypothrix sp. NIES-4075]
MLDKIQGFRLSPQQKRLWLLQKDSLTYCAQCAILIEGSLKIEVLKQALQKIADRHEILRTTFHRQAGISIPIQVINDNSLPNWYDINLSDCSSQEQQIKIEELFQQNQCSPFDFEQSPLLRLFLLTLSAQKYILLISLPSICTDTWSLKNLVRELSHSYEACLQGKELCDDVIQYAQFSEWQNELLEDEDNENGKEYWRKQDIGAFPILKLPFEDHLSKQARFEPESFILAIEPEVVTKMEAIVREYNTSNAVFLLACWQTLLWRLTGQEDFVVSNVYDGRNYEELHSAMGLFAKSLPVYWRFEESFQFREILAFLTEATSDAYAWQEYFTSKDNEEVTEENVDFRSLTFEFAKLPSKHCVAGVSFSVYKQYICFDKFKVKLSCIRTDSSLIAEFHYNTQVFTQEDIKRLAGQFHTLLGSAINNPETTVGKLYILSDIEQQLLVKFNNTETNYPKNKCIHHLFEEQVQTTPDTIAVVYENQQLTYHQLNARANQLAHYLQELGVGPEVLVGICAKRSLEMVVGLLGILKAGGAYVPLDPSYPPERLTYMLSDAQVSVLLTQQSIQQELLEHQANMVICLDADWEVIAQQSQDNFSSGVESENLAYVIYTSGSTGKPKGTAIVHRGLVNYLSWCTKAYKVTEGIGTPVHSSIGFDATITGLFSPLLVGRTIFLLPEQEEIEALAKVLRSQSNFSLVKLTPAHLQLINSVLPPEEASHQTRSLIIGGEALSAKTVSFWLTHAPDTKLINEYGPTETVVGCCVYEVTAKDASAQTVAIGRPIANTQIYILDRHLQQVPIGVPGELHIGGVGLARGYLNRPELTAEKFIPNPFGTGCLYKTGDLARYKSDGNIEFLGRIDYQVKVRGFRIELGEIESVLSTYPQVQQVVVVDREDELGDKRLVAYLVVSDPSVSPNELRSFLKPQLPEYMMPSAFVLLKAMPLTHNGKVDRLALPAPDAKRAREKEFVPAQTLTQELIANIFTAVLKVPVGIYDNFFELGGHSLLATQIISRFRQAFEVDVPLGSLFKSPTVAELDRALSELRQIQPLPEQKLDVSLPPLVPDPDQRHQPFPLTDIQQAYWLGRDSTFDLGNIASHAYFEIDCENLNLERLNKAWQHLVDRHDMLRAVVLPNGQQQVQELVPPYQFQVLDLRQSPQIATQLEAIRDQMSHQVLPADQLPLFEIRASILDEKRIRLHLSIDALVADAFSLNLIGQQWLQLYQNPDSLLPKIELSFRDYVLAALAFKDTPQYQRDRKYWLNRLNTLPPAPELPLTRNLTSTQEPQFHRRSAQLCPEDWQQLKNKAVRANLTFSSVLLAAFVDILNLWSKNPKFTINLTLFNRLPLHPQVNDLVGDFTSLNLLEVDNSIAALFTNRAQRLQQQLWQDLDHQYFSGVDVQRELRRQRGSYQPMGVVFTSILGLNSLAQEEFNLNQLGEMVYGISQTPQVWLDQQIYEQDGALVFNWDAVKELFPVGLLDDMFETYCNWLKNLATSDSAWDKLYPQLLPPSQLELISAVNDTATRVSEKTLHGLFIEQVKLHAQAIAIITPERTLTYEELYLKANQLGHQLRQLGATPNTLVAVVMEKGWEQVVAVLGILISGAAYLPIDVELPRERQLYLLEQGEVKLVLTQSRLQEKLSLPKKVECLLVDTEELSELNSSSLESVQSSTDLAYVIYTSGSTGVPKGVMIDHQGAVNTILDINQRFRVGRGDRVLALSALNFDLSVYDIFGLLAAGGCLVIPSPEKIKDPSHWLELMTSHQVTLWNTVPALMQMLVEYLTGNPDKVTLSLQLALLSGDWIPLSLPKQVKALGSDVQVMSLGGATEASIWSIYYPIEEVDPSWKSIPYGKPLLNQRFYVFNELMQPCPLWVSGQLYIGGIGLAQGYWKNQLKTQASFITHPVTQERLYKTGDLGRYLPDGNIEFLGREDFQVKINGYRVELGEIEAVLRQHPTVKEAVVTIVGEPRETKRLVAYVVQKATSNLQPAESEAYDPHQLQGVIVDPLERIEFKLGQPGLRQLQSAQTTIELPKPEFDEALTQAYLARQSYREFLPKSISLEEFSQFFSCLLPMQLENYPLPKYRYPSAGNLYPVQTYLFVKPNAVNGLEAGIYYYYASEHRLVLLSSVTEIDDSVYGGNQSIFEQSAFSVFLIGQLSAISPMYGELAMNFCLLEAGHMGQLLMSNAAAYSIGLCPIGNLEFSKLRELFKLESTHNLLYSFVGGKIDSSQTKRWFSSNSGQKANSISDELREYLRQKLPEYMVPKSFMQLEALPLTPNGKVNYKALPQPEVELQQEKAFVAPRTSVEKQLAQMVESILSLDRVGIYDNFFEVGGDSLLATRLISRIRETFAIELTLRQFFEDSTVSNIADYIETVSWVGQEVVAEIELEEEEI